MPFDLQPVLEGELLRLRPLQTEDFDALFAAASDPLIWEQHPEPQRYTLPVFRTYFDGGIASRGALVVIERASGRIVGSSRYHDLDVARSQVEIGYTFLARAFWGGAYNGELKRLMLDHAFRFVERVVFVVGEHNLRSQKAVLKLGATLSGPLERPGGGGEFRRNVLFELPKSTWVAR